MNTNVRDVPNPARIAVIDLGLSNVGSVISMLKKAGVRAEAVSESSRLSEFDRIVLPGVGAFDRGMERLEAGGWRKVLEREVIERGKPILGICLGLQLFCRKSEEGRRPGLGWLDADVVRLGSREPASFGPARPQSNSQTLKVPHMGWNEVTVLRPEPLFGGSSFSSAADDAQAAARAWKFYFLHSYRVRCDDPSLIHAVCRYGSTFPCALGKNRVMGVQFHPEKSHAFGLRLMKHFAERAV